MLKYSSKSQYFCRLTGSPLLLSPLPPPFPRILLQPTEELPLAKLTLFDLNEPKMLDAAVTSDPRVEIVLGDLCDKETMEKVVAPDGCARVTVIHLAALLSGQ